MPAKTSAKRSSAPKKSVVESDAPHMPPAYQYPPYPYPPKQGGGLSNILIVLLIVLAFFSGYLFFKVQNLEKNGGNSTTTTTTGQTAQQQPQPPQVKIDQVKKLFSGDYMHFGDASKKVLFVEISDPSCPYCHVADGLDSAAIPGDQFKYVADGGSYVAPLPEMRKLVDSGQASYAMIYSTGHGNGRLGAEALYCANEKGKFWDVHDLLMNQQGYNLLNNTVKNDRSQSDQLAQYLAPAIDSGFMSQCLKSAKYEKTLVRDEQLSPSLGFGGTPTFLVNTTLFTGAYSWKDMSSAVDSALK